MAVVHTMYRECCSVHVSVWNYVARESYTYVGGCEYEVALLYSDWHPEAPEASPRVNKGEESVELHQCKNTL